jgi:AMP-binding enzyme.
MVVGLLGIMKTGAAYVPLDPAYPKDRLNAMIASSGLSLLLTQQAAASALPACTARLVFLDSDWPAIAATRHPITTGPACTDSLAYVIYTSGSTGQPKGVQISHRALLNFLLSMSKQPGLSADETLLAVTTISFDIATLELYLPLISERALLWYRGKRRRMALRCWRQSTARKRRSCRPLRRLGGCCSPPTGAARYRYAGFSAAAKP